MPILMSHLFANSLSPAAYRFCRRIDKVTVKGSEDPVELFTFDVTDIPDYLGAVNSQGRAKARFGGDPTKEIRRALELKPGDGPCQTLLRVMGEAAEAPDSWAGVRNLTEK